MNTRISAPLGALLMLPIAFGSRAGADPAATQATTASPARTAIQATPATAARTATQATPATAPRPATAAIGTALRAMTLTRRTRVGAGPAITLPVDPNTPPPTVDAKALDLLDEVEKAAIDMKSLTADATVSYKMNPAQTYTMEGKVSYLKPNYMHVETWDHVDGAGAAAKSASDDKPNINASDGRHVWYVSKTGQYFQSAADPMGHGLGSGLDPISGFFETAQSPLKQIDAQRQQHTLASLTYAGAQTWDGQPYDVVDWTYRQPYPTITDGKLVMLSQTLTNHIYIGADKVIHRVAYETSNGQSGDRAWHNVQVNPRLTAKNFAFTPPEGSKPYQAPQQPATSGVLANGTVAPDFAANAPDGSTVHLSDYKGKTVIIDFWATWCGPCQASMPHLNEVYKQVKDKDVVVLAVCVWDDLDAYTKWVKDHKTTYDFPTYYDPSGKVGKGIAGSLYNVTGIPAQFVIDKNGKVAAGNVGYGKGDHRLETELAQLGVDIPVPQDK